MRETFPLRWPTAWPRTPKPQYSRFKSGLRDAKLGLERELNLLGARSIELTSDVVRNKDGTQSKVQPRQMDQGVAVYFDLNGEQRCIPCDRWMTMADNIHAIELTVGALRGLDRWGAKSMVDAAFAGFAALPASTSGEGWWDVLELPATATVTEIDAAYRRLARVHHPDAGGDSELFHRITEAYRFAKDSAP